MTVLQMMVQYIEEVDDGPAEVVQQRNWMMVWQKNRMMVLQNWHKLLLMIQQ